ncbi:heparinase II/III domain-containing protein [Geofilum sp. OHC36d9]|uniref:heparinase II/III domain-containing protein n=1 Tax=Geofilum sp. OHC36d9 TaxID=3458413 RepID=UPI00403353E6
MNKIYCVTIILLLSIFMSCSTRNKNTIPEHPRIAFNKQLFHDTENLPDHVIKLNKVLISTADEMLLLPAPEFKMLGRRLLPVSRRYLKRVGYLSYAYQLTNDKKYLDKAEELLLKASSFQTWNPDLFLDVAEMTMAMSIGYDWLYNDLPNETKEIVKQAILEKGLKQATDDSWWLKVDHNWNQVCNASITFGALALYEDYPEFCDSLIRRAISSIEKPKQVYEPDGIYPEGAMYWDYGTSFHCLFLDAYSQNFPDETISIGAGFLKSGDFYLNVFGPNGNFNFSDNREPVILSPTICWFANELQKPELLFNIKPLLQDVMDGKRKIDAESIENRLLPFMISWISGVNFDNNKPSNMFWKGDGKNPLAIFRTGWDKTSTFVAVKGGSPGLNHGHMDAGSFVMDANGKRWAFDLGMHDYNTLEEHGINLFDGSQTGDRWKVFRYINKAHNTLTFDNKHQLVDGSAKIIATTKHENLKSATVDLTPVYRESIRKAIRTVALLNNGKVLITDEIENNMQDSEVRWSMVTVDNVKINSSHSAVITQEDQKMAFRIISPENAQIELFSAQPVNDFEDKNPGKIILGFKTKIEGDRSIKLEVELQPIQTK